MAKRTITDSIGRTRKATRRSWGKVEKLPSGNYRARYVGPDGHTYTAPMTFSAVLDADAWLATQRSRIAAGTWTPATPTADAEVQAERARNLGDYAAAWIDTRTGRNGAPLRGTTRAEYERLVRGPLAPLTALPVAALTPAKIRDWYSTLVKSGTKTTAARAYGLLRSVMQTAVGDRLIPENPCQVRGAQNASTGRKVLPPTEAELAIIESTMPDRLRAAVSIAAWGGLRYGELTELRRGDILLDDNVILIQVARAVTNVPGVGFVVGAPKSDAGVRGVALPPALTSVIQKHLDEHTGAGPDALLFPSRDGDHLAQSTFAKAWYPARAAAGRPDMPWHALRHYSITRYGQAGATEVENMERHGQVTPSVNMKYQHGTGRDAVLAARMMAS